MAVTEAPAEALAAIGLEFRDLAPGDAEGALALSTEAGWNQNGADWRYLLGAALGWGAVDDRGRLAATAMVLPYGDVAGWICMVLVAQAWRRKGIASHLLRHAIAETRARNLLAGLDATAAGRAVYGPLGFRDVYGLTRLAADGPRVPETDVPGLRPMAPADLDALRAFDGPAFGADRAPLFRHLLDRAPDLAWVAERDGAIAGFVLGRDGRRADQLGPIVATDGPTAVALAARALGARRRRDRPCFVDVANHHGGLRDWFTDADFAPQRTFMRMLHGRAEPLDDPARVFAIAGPELG